MNRVLNSFSSIFDPFPSGLSSKETSITQTEYNKKAGQMTWVSIIYSYFINITSQNTFPPLQTSPEDWRDFTNRRMEIDVLEISKLEGLLK